MHKKVYITWGIILLAVIGGFAFMKFANAKDQDKLDNLAKCLTKNGARFYGAYWCPHCANQKALFGSSIKYVTYIECADPTNPDQQNAVCTDAGISGYPTWTFASGRQLSGEVPLDELAKEAECDF